MLKIENPQSIDTPCYYYDLQLLRQTIQAALDARPDDRYRIHYAVKANNNPVILREIAAAGLGADCVSMGEVQDAIDAGIAPSQIVLAGVAKRDCEIEFALKAGIKCLNVESVEELLIIDEIASRMGIDAPVTLRVNPDIDAHTHSYITTGLEENKFGIDRRMLPQALQACLQGKRLKLQGLHFHIGSQILTMEPIALLCQRINEIVAQCCTAQGIRIKSIDVGGGLGIDYDNPDQHPIADFKGLFDTIRGNLNLGDDQECLIEPGRAIVAQCGTLLARVVFVKQGIGRKFAIIDAGMNDLIRPALYGAHHLIQNITSQSPETEKYDVVGPVCESDDIFGKDEVLPITSRGDMLAIRSAGAYGETMASTYNHRSLPGACFSIP